MTTTTLAKPGTNTCGTVPAETKERIQHAVPAVDLYETKKDYVLVADVPGATPENVDVRIEGEDLAIEVTVMHTPVPGIPGGATRVIYKREFALGRGLSREDIAATLKHGVLTVTLPKTPERQPRQIKVNH